MVSVAKVCARVSIACVGLEIEVRGVYQGGGRKLDRKGSEERGLRVIDGSHNERSSLS